MNSLWHFVNQWQVHCQLSGYFHQEEPERKKPKPKEDHPDNMPENPVLPEISGKES